MSNQDLYGFDRDDLRDIADGLDAYEKTINVGDVTGAGDDLLESTTAAAARFIRAAIAAKLPQGEMPSGMGAPLGWQLIHMPDGWSDIIERLIYCACKSCSAAEVGRFMDFRRMLCARPYTESDAPAEASEPRKPVTGADIRERALRYNITDAEALKAICAERKAEQPPNKSTLDVAAMLDAPDVLNEDSGLNEFYSRDAVIEHLQHLAEALTEQPPTAGGLQAIADKMAADSVELDSDIASIIYKNLDSLLDAEQPPAAAPVEPIHQYYFQLSDCKAGESADADCICWHREGTGPAASARHDAPDSFCVKLEWRQAALASAGKAGA